MSQTGDPALLLPGDPASLPRERRLPAPRCVRRAILRRPGLKFSALDASRSRLTCCVRQYTILTFFWQQKNCEMFKVFSELFRKERR